MPSAPAPTINNWQLRTKKTDVAKRTRVIDNIGLLFNGPPDWQVALYLVSRKVLFQAIGLGFQSASNRLINNETTSFLKKTQEPTTHYNQPGILFFTQAACLLWLRTIPNLQDMSWPQSHTKASLNIRSSATAVGNQTLSVPDGQPVLRNQVIGSAMLCDRKPDVA